jgi:FtsP/CotA-like multicopper oxidase with cupredoxin domain
VRAARSAARIAAVDLRVAEAAITLDGRRATAVAINGTVPGPILRFREGDEAVIRVTNALDEDTSIHWHGIILPNEMDGVPGVTFAGIPPRTTFTYRYPLSSTVRTGTTATRGCRSRSVTTRRSSSTRANPSRSGMSASTS